MSAEQVGTMRDLWETQSAPGRIAATLYTSGQTLGLLLAGVLAILLVTNEYQYRTLTATFLAAPRRGRVVTAKLVVVLISSAGLWLAATLGSLLVGGIFLTSQGAGLGLGSGDVLGAVLLNLAAYLVWGVFGFGLGVLIRSQTAATVTAAVLYFLSSVVVAFAFQVVHDLVLEENWVLQAQVLLPGVASQIMTTPGELFAGAPAPWTGAAVLVAYSLAAWSHGNAAAAPAGRDLRVRWPGGHRTPRCQASASGRRTRGSSALAPLRGLLGPGRDESHGLLTVPVERRLPHGLDTGGQIEPQILREQLLAAVDHRQRAHGVAVQAVHRREQLPQVLAVGASAITLSMR